MSEWMQEVLETSYSNIWLCLKSSGHFNLLIRFDSNIDSQHSLQLYNFDTSPVGTSGWKQNQTQYYYSFNGALVTNHNIWKTLKTVWSELKICKSHLNLQHNVYFYFSPLFALPYASSII